MQTAITMPIIVIKAMLAEDAIPINTPLVPKGKIKIFLNNAIFASDIILRFEKIRSFESILYSLDITEYSLSLALSCHNCV